MVGWSVLSGRAGAPPPARPLAPAGPQTPAAPKAPAQAPPPPVVIDRIEIVTPPAAPPAPDPFASLARTGADRHDWSRR